MLKYKSQENNSKEGNCPEKAALERSEHGGTGKYLSGCHGTRPPLRILFKQSVTGGGGTGIPMRAAVTTSAAPQALKITPNVSGPAGRMVAAWGGRCMWVHTAFC